MKQENIADIYKLTPIQQGILFHSLYTPGSGVYFEQFGWTVNQEWIVPVFERAWQYVVDQHPILRTAFFWEDLDEPIQVVQRQARLPFISLDWSDLSPAEQEARLETYLQTDRDQGFDLTEAPLMRVTIIRGGPERFHFVWSYHHLLLDGWSVPLIIQDVFTAYSAFVKDQQPRMARRRPYRDYLAWLRKKDLSEAENYWRPMLKGFSEPTPLPFDHGAGRDAEVGYNKLQLEISPEQTEALQALARRERLTLSTLVHGAWSLLLQGYSGGQDLVIGSTVSGRPADLAGSETMVGCFINTLPMRVQTQPNQTLRDWLLQIQQQQVQLLQYAYSPLVEVQRWSDMPPGERLFESIVVFENYPTDALSEAELRIFQKTNYPLTLVAVPRQRLILRLNYETQHFDAATIERLLAQLQILIEGMIDRLDQPLSQLTLLSEDERRRLLVDWNATSAAYDQDACLHTLIERQVEQTPEAVALAFEDTQLTYAELNARANQLAHHLQALGVGPEKRVAICMKRSADLLVGLLAILKAGGAYVPLDPAYPATRLAFMLQDSAPTVLLSESRVAAQLPSTNAQVVLLDRAGPTLAAQPTSNPNTVIAPEQIAYMIYTSGSTGQPKGVMVPHGPVVNFLAAMQSQIGCGSDDALLATTSISFDISVLELFWPLTQGAKVVILAEHAASGMTAQAEHARSDRAIDFSLFYFASDDSGDSGDKYRLLIEGAKFADQHGFSAVWTPERHFHEFGGLYPNPAITSAALATITQNVQLRAGSVVMPLHDPIRVAEEWSVVDNISKGRVGIAFASGWHANDFVFFPERYAQRKQATADGLAAVQKLWRGESLTVQSGAGKPIDVKIFPKPVQPELPIWITAAGNPETFIEAGKTGANVLTHLLGQSLEDVAEKVRLYRAARAESGLDPETGKITLMLHTFIGDDRDAVRELVREPFTNYLRSSAGLVANLAKSINLSGDMNSLSQADMDALLAFAFDRYFETSALFGTVETCAEMIERLKAIGVDEIGCLVDFGVEAEQALAALEQLNTLRELTSQPIAKTGASLPAQAQRHHATLLQGTPSLAKLLLLQPDTLTALRSLRALLLGGEALPTALAQQLLPMLGGRLINMYGPTETTIWSATHPVTEATESNMPIGKPIANTEIYILDARLQPTPISVPGELYIGGVGVTRGYYQHPALTAERYLPDPFGPRPGGRIYKTGDLARYRADGTIEFLGRVDFQVKLRGFRIELGEIEAVLGQHPAIREAVVVARQDTADTRLVAYVVEEPRTQNLEPREHQTFPSPAAAGEGEVERSETGVRASTEGLNFTELRSFIKERLPEYMVPSAFVTLDALPLTPNGKVDRKALPAPDASLASIEPAAMQPRTPTEEVVASLWERVLGVQNVGVHDNFFMLGGHSLLATQILSRVRETFQVELALSTLFNTPTVAGMAEQVERAQQKASGLQAPPIEHVSRDRPLPLSFAQQRIWFLQQVEPESATYNNPTAIGLKGALDLPALTQTLNTIVQRHEILRTTFHLLDGRPVQQIVPRLTLDLPSIDLSSLPADEQQAELRHIGTREAQRPFDLVSGPPIRALIFKHSEHEHTLLVTMHHIVSDGWSLGVLIREMAVLYTSLSSGQAQLEARALPELPIQYADYASWQRSWLQGEVLEAQQAYWKQQLSGHIPALNLPTDHPRPPVRTYRGAKQSLHFAKPLLDQLNLLSRSAGTTLFMTLMSGLNALLYRYSGQTDLVIGSPIANRHHGQVEELIGCFINTLVLRSDLSGNPTFTQLLERSREVALGAYAHQDLPFEQVVEIAEYEADISRHPLFQVFFILQNTPMGAVSLGDLTLTTVDITTETAKFDLAFELIETDIGIIGSVEYNTDIFEATTIARMIGHFERLLEYCAANPEQRLSDLVFLGETERQQLLVDWNATTVDYPQDVALHTLIEQQVARTPEATALVFEGQPLTYAELNARANQLAHHLRTVGVGPETRVAVCMERSLELVIALVGVIKAGGAYVPVDPSYPTDRIQFMLADAAAPVLLTQQHLAADLPPHTARVLRLDADWSTIAQQPVSNPALITDANNLAYMIYTSGSTGQPKGAMNTHQAIVNRLLWMQDAFGLTGSDRVLQKTPFSFDVSVWEFFWPLLTGATLVVAKPGGHQDSAYLVELIARERITTLHFVPSM
ncbi:MAG: LLM class flavin-dependent oxidoreductase, partial [Chloroflexi bacterium]|nr:LLM class flavin-dependent oxidoreductase [Chloroflexota bacterium]